MRNRQRVSLVVGVITALAARANVFAGDTNATPARTIDQRIDELDQEIRALKRQRELDQEQADQAAQKAKETPIVTAGPEGFALKSADGNFVLRLRGYADADSRFFLNNGAHNGT